MRGPEAKVKDAIKTYLKEIGAYQFWPVQTGYGAATLDCLCCWRGLFLGIEVKRGDTRPLPTVRQQQTAQEIAAAGGATVVAYSVEDVISRLRAMHQFTSPSMKL
jgi:hypothetical protein